MEIIAHRGAGQGHLQPDTAPENTLPAFVYAWSQEVNAGAAELDIHLTKDDAIIVIHDDCTDRTTDARWVVAEHTLAELRSLDAGSWKSPHFAGIRLPTLEEVIETIPSGKRLFTEMKTGPRIIGPLVRTLRGCGKSASQLPLISFHFDAIRAAKEKLPEHQCYLLVDFELADLEPAGGGRQPPGSTELEALIQRVEGAGLDGIDASYPMPRGLSDRIRDHHLQCVVWTVNDTAAAREVIDRGIRSITTDLPRQMRTALLGRG